MFTCFLRPRFQIILFPGNQLPFQTDSFLVHWWKNDAYHNAFCSKLSLIVQAFPLCKHICSRQLSITLWQKRICLLAIFPFSCLFSIVFNNHLPYFCLCVFKVVCCRLLVCWIGFSLSLDWPLSHIQQIGSRWLWKYLGKHMEKLYKCMYINWKRVENILTNKEIACFEQFLLLSQCFQMLSVVEVLESVYMWERVTH